MATPTHQTRPILYSFRRCPYAMRARMAIAISGVSVELREIKLRDKPAEMLEASPKGTVPVLVLASGQVIDQSLEIMLWALGMNDPEGWLSGHDEALIAEIDGPFKHHLDRYKYPGRYENCDALEHRTAALGVLQGLEARLAQSPQLCGEARTLTDIATFPFIRQFARTEPEWFAALPMPRLQGWLSGHMESELFAGIMGKYEPWKSDDEGIKFP